MRKIFVLLATMLGVVSCQIDHEGFGANVGGEQEANITVSLPEATRANSALGAIGNDVLAGDYTIRYIFQIYNSDNTQSKEPVIQYSDATTVTFPVRLIAGRDYNFVVWADIVKESEKVDLHYNTANFPTITLNDTWVAMDETRDAYTVSEPIENFSGTTNYTLTLKRPFAKLRVITTDSAEWLGITPESATATYTTKHYNTFNALESKAVADSKNSDIKHENYTIKEYEITDGKVLFTDYFFAEEDVVSFNLSVTMSDGKSVDRSFSTDIPVMRNHLTTLIGDILTEGNNINIEVEEEFENADDMIDDAPYYQVAVSNGFALVKALYEDRAIIILNHITVTNADVEAYLATRTNPVLNPVINLNGFTITIENNEAEALVNLNGGALTVEGEGEIISIYGALVEGTTVVTGSAEVDAEAAVDENGNSSVKRGIEALIYICKNGGEFTFTENLEAEDVIFIETTKPVVINGNNKTITSAATRVFRITAQANVTINDLNIVSTAVRAGSVDSIRGISMDGGIDNIVLTLNNCSVDFTSETAHDWSYAINKVGDTSKNAQITINGGTYEGANVINIWGDNNIITLNGTTLNDLYRVNDLYCGCCIRLEGSGNVVTINNTIFTGTHAVTVDESIPNTNIINFGDNNNTENLKLYRFKADTEFYYTLTEAVAATTEGEIKVINSAELSEGVTIANGKSITLNLNGCKIAGTDKSIANFGVITNHGNLTVKGGTMTLKAEHDRDWNAYSSVISNQPGGNLVVEDAVIEHLGGTDMAYGIDNLTNGKGTKAVTTLAEGAVVKSTYRAVRQFLNGVEAFNELYVKAGATVDGRNNKSIWFQDPSTHANSGKLVVEEGATLYGDVYLTVTAGSTQWPVEVSIAKAAFAEGYTLLENGNIPAGYKVVEENGVYYVERPNIVTPETLNSTKFTKSGIYTFVGDFSAVTRLNITPTEGANVTIDASQATFGDVFRVGIPSEPDNTNVISRELGRKGNYTFTNFNDTSLCFGAYGTNIAVTNSTLDCIDYYAANVGLEIMGNTIDAEYKMHPRMAGGETDYAVCIMAIAYDLKFENNNVANAIGHIVAINGLVGTFDSDYSEVGNPNWASNVVSFTGNTITGIGGSTKSERAGFKVWDDLTYVPASVADGKFENLPQAGQDLINRVNNDTSNLFQKADGATTNPYKFSFYNVNYLAL